MLYTKSKKYVILIVYVVLAAKSVADRVTWQRSRSTYEENIHEKSEI